MKIKISYQKDERALALKIENAVNRIADNRVKAIKSDRHEPYYHTYLAIRNNENPHK